MPIRWRSTIPARAVGTALTAFGAAFLTASLGMAASQAVRTDAERAAAMREHFGRVMTMHESVIRGDLPAMKEAATSLAELESDAMPAQAAPYLASIRQSARRAASADTVARAAFDTASMLSTCGDCHRAVGIMPAVPVPLSASREVGGLVGHMLQHQRAADLMLRGLVVPSSSLWREGAAAFLTAALRPDKLPPDPKLTPEIRSAEARLHRIASDAVHAIDSLARANAYGQILASCADCHGLHRQVRGQLRR